MQHLTHDIISQYLNGSLNANQVREVEHHMNQCDFCSDAVDGFNDFPEALSGQSWAGMRKGFQARKDKSTTNNRKIWIPVAASIILIVSFTVVFNRFQFNDLFVTQETPEKPRQESSQSPAGEPKEGEALEDKNSNSSERTITMNNESYAEKDDQAEPPNAKINQSEQSGSENIANQQNNSSISDSEIEPDEAEETIAKAQEGFSRDVKAIEDQGLVEIAEETQLLNGSETQSIAGRHIQPVEKEDTEELALRLDVSPVEEMILDQSESIKSVDNIASVQSKKSSQIEQPAAARSLMPAEKEEFDHEARVISGEIISASDGEPLTGVNVFVKGTTIGTVTDTAGKFTLQLPAGEQDLIIALVGYLTQEHVIDQEDELEVELEEDVAALAEVVVVGYATTHKKDLSFKSPAPVDGMKDFRKYVETNLKYPADHSREKVRVKVGFYVEPNGNLRDFYIVKSMGEAYDQEAIRVIKEGPEWEPAQKNGMPYREKAIVTIRF